MFIVFFLIGMSIFWVVTIFQAFGYLVFGHNPVLDHSTSLFVSDVWPEMIVWIILWPVLVAIFFFIGSIMDEW